MTPTHTLTPDDSSALGRLFTTVDVDWLDESSVCPSFLGCCQTESPLRNDWMTAAWPTFLPSLLTSWLTSCAAAATSHSQYWPRLPTRLACAFIILTQPVVIVTAAIDRLLLQLAAVVGNDWMNEGMTARFIDCFILSLTNLFSCWPDIMALHSVFWPVYDIVCLCRLVAFMGIYCVNVKTVWDGEKKIGHCGCKITNSLVIHQLWPFLFFILRTFWYFHQWEICSSVNQYPSNHQHPLFKPIFVSCRHTVQSG